MNTLNGKTILITGSCGTIGQGLIDIFLADKKYHDTKIIGIDNNESALFFQEQKFLANDRFSFYYCDIRNLQSLRSILCGVQVVLHTAALKHVGLNEKTPDEAVATNVNGVQNIISASVEANVETVVFTSSDKAVNPTNVMGATKLMGERLFAAASYTEFSSKTKFISTRFGNVLGSNGSVVPLFRNQIKSGGPVTLTDPKMTRFIMNLKQACDLVVRSAEMAIGGEIYITKMPTLNIADLAHVLIKEYSPRDASVEIKTIGVKAGEKLYEELMSSEEVRRSIELKDFFVVLPAIKCDLDKYGFNDIVSNEVLDPYVSEQQPKLSFDEIHSFLVNSNLI